MQCIYFNNCPTKHEYIMHTRYEYEKNWRLHTNSTECKALLCIIFISVSSQHQKYLSHNISNQLQLDSSVCIAWNGNSFQHQIYDLFAIIFEKEMAIVVHTRRHT
jgi:hypothetical protein